MRPSRPGCRAAGERWFATIYSACTRLQLARTAFRYPYEVISSGGWRRALLFYIPMPFARSARLALTSEGAKRDRHWFEIHYRRYASPDGFKVA